MLKKQTEKAEEELQKLKVANKGRVGNVFKIVKAIQGPKNGGSMEAHASLDPATGDVAVSGNEIKRISLEYCRAVLTNNEIEEGFENEVNLKEDLHRKRMEDNRVCGFKPSRGTFNKVVHKFKKSNKRNYDFLVYSGNKFKDAVFKLANRMLDDEDFPKSFDETTLHQIYKGKGKKEIMANNRYIHSKEWLPRLVEGMVVEEMKDQILEGSSPFQIGGQPGHQPQEHLFTAKSIMAKYEMEGKMVLLQAYDISKYFDKEVVADVMNTLFELDVDKKAYRTWSKLNKNTRIRVKTGVGLSEWSDEGAMIGQGTGGGALVSQANLDKGIMDIFAGSEEEVRYGGVRILPLMFQDDIMRVADGVSAARAGNVKVAFTMNSKQLQLNKDKTSYIIVGSGKQAENARTDIERLPIMCGSFATKEKVSDKWLGDMFHQGGLELSVMATIEDREPKVKGAFYEAAAIVDDWRTQSIGGFMSAIDLFEMAILPTLLYNSETWVNISRQATERLDNLQLFYLRLILRVPKSTPKPALRSETGMLGMKVRIWKQKLMFTYHLKNLKDGVLAKDVWKEQLQNDWPGLAREVSQICIELGMEDANETELGKGAFRSLVNKACKEFNDVRLKDDMKDMKKLEGIKSDNCNTKPYLASKSLNEVRSIFRARTNMTEGFKGNFKNMHNDINCVGCQQVQDTQNHSMVCPAYTDLREGMDFAKDLDMIRFFRLVMERRAENQG